MINKYVAMGLGALIALAPVAALAQEQVAQAATDNEHGLAGKPAIPARIAATSAARATRRGTGRGLRLITCTRCARPPPRLRRAD